MPHLVFGGQGLLRALTHNTFLTINYEFLKKINKLSMVAKNLSFILILSYLCNSTIA